MGVLLSYILSHRSSFGTLPFGRLSAVTGLVPHALFMVILCYHNFCYMSIFYALAVNFLITARTKIVITINNGSTM